MEFGLQWVHMARYELILRLEGALWLTIIFKPLRTPKRTIKVQKRTKKLPQESYLILSFNHSFAGRTTNIPARNSVEKH